MTWRDRVWSAFVCAYPRPLRAQFGADIRLLMHDLSQRAEYRGPRGRLRLLLFLARDVVQSIAREHVSKLPVHGVRTHTRSAVREGPPYGDALLAALGVLVLYVGTLAPTVAFWDSGEYLTAAHILGIPHQPGNPLFVLLAHGWNLLLAPFGLPAAVRINLFSAVASAGAHFFWFLVVQRVAVSLFEQRWLQRLTAALAVLLSATTFTVWNHSNVNEKVYTLSLFTIALTTWLAFRWRDTKGSPRWLLGMAFLIALTSTNHLLGVLVAPALLVFVFFVNRRMLARPRLWLAALGCAAIGLTPNFFLPLRAAQQPVLNEADPSCASLGQAAVSIYSFGLAGCPSLSAALQREQYGKPSVALDPTVYPQLQLPRGPDLLAAQFANYAQYFNWQWARGISGSDSLLGGLRPAFTLLFLFLGVLGARAHWRRDRAGAALIGVLFLTLSLGLVLYLNFKYGFAMLRDRFPDAEMHEVRERDYFFLISFSVWALWAGIGLSVFWRRAASFLTGRVRHPRLLAAPAFALALLPLGLNWQWASRTGDYTARDWAYNVLMSVQPYGVLFTNGDNDTFPLWYLQEVEGIRRDVTVMVTGYLNTAWYARQVRNLTEPCAPGRNATDEPTRIVCQRSYQPELMPLALKADAPAVPEDSILPLSDAQIDQVARGYYIAREPLTFKAGDISTTIPAGTEMLPADTFVAAIVQATLGERPIHFTTPAPSAMKLGLFGHTVRHGLTFKLHDGKPAKPDTMVRMPENEITYLAGAYVDLEATETLLAQVFGQRGRVLDLSLPWVDRATTNILLQYAWAHFAAAQAYAARGDQAAAQKHVEQGEWWQRRAGE